MPCYPLNAFVGDVDEDLLCSVCGGVMDTPMQLPCGHDRGYSCLSSSTSALCGVKGCPKPLPSAPSEIPRLKRLIDKMTVECHLCKWRGPAAQLALHTCPFERILCPFKCGATAERRQMPAHSAECLFRTEECPHCFKCFKVCDLPLHDERCTMKEILCDSCQQRVRRSHMQEHLVEACPAVMTRCPFHEFGCSARVQRAELETHVALSLADHCGLLMKLVQRERSESAAMIDALKQRVSELESELAGKATVDGRPIGEVVRDLEELSRQQAESVNTIMSGRLLTVDASGCCGMFSTISAALCACAPGDVLAVRPGVYKENIELTSPAHDTITIRGAGSDATFLSGRVVARCSVKMSHIAIMNRSDRDAPALRITGGAPRFERLHISSVNLSCCVVDAGTPQWVNCSMSDSQQHALWWRADGAPTTAAVGCTFTDCGQSLVQVDKGCVELRNCDIASGRGTGVSVRSGATLTAVGCGVHDNARSNVEFEGEGRLEMCAIYRSGKCGVFAKGAVELHACKVFENTLPNVFVVSGGKIGLYDSKVLCGLQHGVVVKCGGAATMRGTLVTNNCLDNVAAEEGAIVDM